MNCKKIKIFAIIFFTAALFCFEANTLFHGNTPLYNVENTDSTEDENKYSSNSESHDDCKINYNTVFCFLVGCKFDIPQSSDLIFSYVISFWQPPKMS